MDIFLLAIVFIIGFAIALAATIVVFRLNKTLSDFGSVSRGLCQVEDGKLTTVIETENLRKSGDFYYFRATIVLPYVKERFSKA